MKRHKMKLLDGLLLTIALCYVIMLVSLIYGHLSATASGLSLSGSYLTEYMKRAPHWPWLVVAAFSFALALQLFAIVILLRGRLSLSLVLGCLLIASASMGMFFVAYAPMRNVEQPPPPSHQWWTPTWWFTSHTSHTPYEHGMADAYEDIHYRATKLVVTCGVLAMFCLALGWRREDLWQGFSMITSVCGVLVGLFFLAADRLSTLHGLWQRLGIGLLLVWLGAAWYGVFRQRRSSS